MDINFRYAQTASEPVLFCRDIILKMKTPSKSKSKKSKGAKWDGIREAKYLQNKESKTKSQNSIDAVFDELHEEEEEPTVICEGTRSSGYMMMEEQIEEYKPIGKYVIKHLCIICRIITVFSPLWCYKECVQNEARKVRRSKRQKMKANQEAKEARLLEN